MKSRHFVIYSLSSIVIGGCNTYVPKPQEFYENRELAPVRVQTLVQHIVCELKTAVQTVLVEDLELGPLRKRLGLIDKPRLDWLRTWAVQITLTLTVEEKSSINPSAGFTDIFPNAISRFSRGRTVTTGQFSSLSVAAAYSTGATTKETHSLFINVADFADNKELVQLSIMREQARKSGLEMPRLNCQQNGEVFLRGDLQLTDWLKAATAPVAVQDGIYGDYKKALESAEKKQKKDALSNQITFILSYGGGITPALRLFNFGINQGSNPFVGAQRTNTQDLIVTLGPTENGRLSTPAQNTILASQIGISVANSLRSSQ